MMLCISSKSDWKTAQGLMKLGRYHHALFFCHLTLEKLLKGKIVERLDVPAPPIHDLLKLAKKLSIDFDGNIAEQLKEITNFNLEARYDSYKLEFYKKATKKYATKWFEISMELKKWIAQI